MRYACSGLVIVSAAAQAQDAGASLPVISLLTSLLILALRLPMKLSASVSPTAPATATNPPDTAPAMAPVRDLTAASLLA